MIQNLFFSSDVRNLAVYAYTCSIKQFNWLMKCNIEYNTHTLFSQNKKEREGSV